MFVLALHALNDWVRLLNSLAADGGPSMVEDDADNSQVSPEALPPRNPSIHSPNIGKYSRE